MSDPPPTPYYSGRVARIGLGRALRAARQHANATRIVPRLPADVRRKARNKRKAIARKRRREGGR